MGDLEDDRSLGGVYVLTWIMCVQLQTLRQDIGKCSFEGTKWWLKGFSLYALD
jgi:hypothetical protein